MTVQALALLTDDELVDAYNAECARLGILSDEAAAVVEMDVAVDIELYAQLDSVYPLSTAVLWEKPEAEWDQRRFVAEMVHPLTVGLGGNRGGKTYALLEAAAAFAMGGDHPAVIAWLEDNDLPRDMIPDGPGEVYLVANSAGVSIKIHRFDLMELLPPGCHWRSQSAPQEASVEIPVPGYDRPGKIWFKSTDQGHRAFKGDELRFIGLSEEPEGEEGRLVLDECMRACSTVNGRVVLEMTPQNGMTWVYDDLVEGGKYGARIVTLDSSFNLMVPDRASFERWLASLSEEERRMRQHGEFVDRRGLVYTSWRRSYDYGHLCEPFDIPADWPRFRGGDWGQTERNGTAVIWGALSPDGTLYLYREYYVTNEPSFRVHALNCRQLEPRDEVVQVGWADHEEEAIEEFANEGMPMELANKDVEGGISRCSERMRVVGTHVRLQVFHTLRRFIFEVENYRRDPNKRDGAPIKRNDHMLDAWRYLENGIAEWDGGRAAYEAHIRDLEQLVGRFTR